MQLLRMPINPWNSKEKLIIHFKKSLSSLMTTFERFSFHPGHVKKEITSPEVTEIFGQSGSKLQILVTSEDADSAENINFTNMKSTRILLG